LFVLDGWWLVVMVGTKGEGMRGCLVLQLLLFADVLANYDMNN